MPQLFSQLPETIQMFTGNGIVMSSLTAILLNLIFNGLKDEKKTKITKVVSETK